MKKLLRLWKQIRKQNIQRHRLRTLKFSLILKELQLSFNYIIFCILCVKTFAVVLIKNACFSSLVTLIKKAFQFIKMFECVTVLLFFNFFLLLTWSYFFQIFFFTTFRSTVNNSIQYVIIIVFHLQYFRIQFKTFNLIFSKTQFCVIPT